MTDGSLVLDIALGVILANLLTPAIKRMFQRVFLRRTVPSTDDPQDPSAEDWDELWDGLSDSAKEQSKKILEDERLRRRAQESNLWPYLWSAAPEETKEKLRSRWRVAKVPPRASTTAGRLKG